MVAAYSERVEEVFRPSKKDFLENFFGPKRPVLMHGMTESWPATQKWDFNYLKKVGAGKKVRIEVGNILAGKTQLQIWPFEKYLEYVENSRAVSSQNDPDSDVPYLSAFEIFRELPNLKGDLKFSFWDGRFCFPIGWIGPKDSYSGIHWDSPHNLFTMFLGSKEFTIYPPDQSPYLYPSPKFDKGAFLSSVDGKKRDYEKFPLFRNAKSMTVVVKPGSILFIPRGWWHQVKSLEASISVSCFSFSPYELVMIGIPVALKYALHGLGVYKRNNCTCHEAKQSVEPS